MESSNVTLKFRDDLENCLTKYVEEEYGDMLYMRLPKSGLFRMKRNANYKREVEDIVAAVLKSQGLSKDFLDPLKRFTDEIDAATPIGEMSIDSNANKSDKNVRAMLSEAQNPGNKLIGFYYLHNTMKKLYGLSCADRLLGELISYSLGINDSTNILIPYCFAMDASSIITIGRQFGQLWSKPVKRLSSYVSVLNEVAHSFTNQIAGALAVATFFTDAAYVLNNLEKFSLEDIRRDAVIKAHHMTKNGHEKGSLKLTTVRKYVENCMESFVYSMNALTRITYESPFTNISIFSPDKLRNILSDEGRSWYIKATEIPGKPDASDAEKMEYMVQYTLELQEIYMDFFDKGDPCKGGANFRFPVSTINVSKVEVGVFEDGTPMFDIEPDDMEFVEKICANHKIHRYNNMISLGAQVASCCFIGEAEVPLKVGTNRSYTLYTLENIYKEWEADNELPIRAYQNGKWVNVKPVRIPSRGIGDIKYSITLEDGTSIPFCTEDHLFMVDGKIFKRAAQLTTRDLIYIDKSFMGSAFKPTLQRVKRVGTHAYPCNYVYCLQVVDKDVANTDSTFTLSNGIVSHNCRLITDVAAINKYGAQVNSFGGSMTSYGSHRVVTINFPRIARETDTFDEFMAVLNNRLRDAIMILHAHRELLKEMTANGKHPFFKNGWMSLNRLFSTVGILGVSEAVEILVDRFMKSPSQMIPKECPNRDKFESSEVAVGELKDLQRWLTARMLREVSEKVARYSEDTEFKNPFNIEQIPGESMAVRFAEIDNRLFRDTNDYQMYSNQFIPLWKDSTLWQRMEEDGRYNQLLTGGGIVHFNLGEETTPEQNLDIYKYAVKCGCEHFALNPVYSLCKKNHYNFGKSEKCPVCGEDIVDYYTRVVGFFVPVSAWNKTRKTWEFPQRKFTGVDNKE